MNITGIDLSLTATGVATIDTDTGDVTVRTIGSKGHAHDGLRERHTRLDDLRDRIMRHVDGADVAVIEQPAFSRTTGRHHDRSGLWWLILDALIQWDTGAGDVVEVTPGGLKKYATGKGGAGKDEVLLAVARRYPHVAVADNNQADALILAAMGARRVGHPIEQSLAKTNLAAMEAVRWPEFGHA